MPHHDLVIIGSGSGNSILDSRFDDQDVALIEHGVFGGTCLNSGCIPTKMYVYASDVAETIREAGRYGIDAGIDKVRWADIRDRVFGRIDPSPRAGGATATPSAPTSPSTRGTRGSPASASSPSRPPTAPRRPP